MPAPKSTVTRAPADGLGRALPDLRRAIPTGRSLLLGFVLLLLGLGAYAAALETSVFAVRSLDIRGGTPEVRAEVRAALAGELGRSLLRVDGGDVAGRLAGLPDVASVRYDRAFPNTLRVTVRAERPVLIVRRGPDAFLVAASGRVLQTLPHPQLSSLPRLWLPSHTQITVAGQLSDATGGAAPIAVAALHGVRLPSPVRTVTAAPGALTLDLASGFQIRLGDGGDIRLKLAIARRILASAQAGATGPGYVDVSVPERPVLNTNPQVKG